MPTSSACTQARKEQFMSAIVDAAPARSDRATRLPIRAGGYFAYHGVWSPGVRFFRRLGFGSKAVIISLVFVLPTLALVAWLLKTSTDETMQLRMNATRQQVGIAHGVLAWAHAQQLAGKMTREQAQQMAAQIVGQMRYDDNEYFWISDMQPRMVMHPSNTELEGKNLGDIKDPNGFAFFDAMAVTVRRHSEGFVAYQWPRPGSKVPVDKISFVQGFEPWGWIIGTSVFVDDLRQALIQQIALAAGVVACAMLIAGYLFFSFYRVMDGGLKETRRHLRAMAAGDLTTSPAPWGRDEGARLMLELRSMQDALRDVVARVRRASDEIVQSSSKIAAGAADLSARTEQAAINLEEASSSMEQISATAKNAAELSSEASQVARRNAQVAADGGHVMREVVQTMEGIRSASAKIGEIIATIDGIAFQTNILALNAAVEAARAGEQGRGFAVVASEVRMLAQRSAEAARQIKALIGGSVEKVEAGTEIVRRAGATIEEIVASSQRVDHLLSEVANGAREQGIGIAQVSRSVQELDKMTQQNATLVEQTANASSAMKEQAHALVGQVSHFYLAGAPETHRSSD